MVSFELVFSEYHFNLIDLALNKPYDEPGSGEMESTKDTGPSGTRSSLEESQRRNIFPGRMQRRGLNSPTGTDSDEPPELEDETPAHNLTAIEITNAKIRRAALQNRLGNISKRKAARRRLSRQYYPQYQYTTGRSAPWSQYGEFRSSKRSKNPARRQYYPQYQYSQDEVEYEDEEDDFDYDEDE